MQHIFIQLSQDTATPGQYPEIRDVLVGDIRDTCHPQV